MTQAEQPLVDLGDFKIRKKLLSDGLDDYLWRREPETARMDGSDGADLTLGEFLERLQADLESPFGSRRWFALISDEGVHFGTIVLTAPSYEAATAELGITVGRPEFRDRGIGKRALSGFLRYVWRTTNIRRIELHTFDWNERAHRCFLRAGFQDVARVVRGDDTMLRMEARREWWLMWDGEGRFDFD